MHIAETVIYKERMINLRFFSAHYIFVTVPELSAVKCIYILCVKCAVLIQPFGIGDGYFPSALTAAL